MAELLDLNLPIVDENGRPTPYFEDIWYNIIASLGGEGAAPITSVITVETTSEQTSFLVAQVKKLRQEVDDIKNQLGDP